MKKEEKKDDVLKGALEKLRKQYGSGVILQEKDVPKNIEAISTNCFAIDRLLGCGGLPRGRIIEIFGEPSEGKSTLCLYLAGQVQRTGGKVAYLDAESAYDASYAKNLGVTTEDLLVAQPETLEETFDIIRALAETNSIDLIVVDSVAALVPKSELEGAEMLKDTVALQARLMGRAMRIITGPISRSRTIVIFINQTREKVGVVWGSPQTTPGGKALKFFSSVRLKVSKGDKILGKDKVEQIGNTVIITAVKNKVGMPFRRGTFDLYYGTGVDLVSDTFDTAEEFSLIKKEGITYSFEEVKIGVGRDAAIKLLKMNKELYEKIHKATKDAFTREREKGIQQESS